MEDFYAHIAVKTKDGFRPLTETEKIFAKQLSELNKMGVSATFIYPSRRTKASTEKYMLKMIEEMKRFKFESK